MAMQVKHMLAVGLGLGVASALGYSFLSSPQYTASVEPTAQLMPLSHFELAPTPSAISNSTPIPVQPQVDNQFRTEATPLRPPTIDQAVAVEPSSSYSDLVAAAQETLAAQDTLPVLTKPVGFQQLVNESQDSEDSFSLDLSSPENDNEPEFAFDAPAQTLQLQDDDSAPSPSDLSFVENQNDTPNDFAPIADQMPAGVTAPSDSTRAVVVDYSSAPIDRTAIDRTAIDQTAANGQKSEGKVWKTNPFINNGPAASETAEATEPTAPASASVLSRPALTENSFVSTPSMLPATSVLSLNDPAQENRIATKPHQAAPIHMLPQSVQTQAPIQANDQVAAYSTPAASSGPMTLNAADALKAVHHIEYGKTLSRRGAAHTARQEFLAAMQLIATSNDKVSGDNRHTKALRLAMLAIKEAGDFSVASSEQQIQMNVASVVESHRSHVLTAAQAENLSPVQAMNRYFAKAQENLDLAGGRNVVSAEVFFCMGKLHTVLSQHEKVLGPYETAKSVVFHQVALLSDNQHYRSANELGVLLARSGRLDQAKLLFERSLMTQPTVRTWQNLAEAHRRLGESDFANQATNEVRMLASSPLPASQSNIQWKPIDQFNADAPIDFNQRVAELPSPPVTPAGEAGPAGKQTAPKTIAERLKRMF